MKLNAHPRPSRLLLLALAASVLAPTMVRAQQEESYQISQRATLSQVLGGAKVTLDYSRPLMRGRTDVFGKTVHWGELWTPGANQATVLEVSEAIRLNGKEVPAGRWSMWIIPSQVGPWELVLDARDSLFHTERPELSDDQIRLVLDARHDAPHTEALAWSFPRIDHDGGTLQLNWGTLEIPLEVGVRSIRPTAALPAEEAASYEGKWRLVFEPHPQMGAPPPTVLTIRRDAHGMLEAHIPPGVFTPPAAAAPTSEPNLETLSPQERERAEARRVLAEYEAGAWEYILVPKAKGIFMMGWADEAGELLEANPFYHEFEFENGRPVKLTVRNEKDEVMGRATREQD